MSKIKNVAVIGAGQMGSGIAQVLAGANFNVLLNDSSESALKGAVEKIATRLDKQIEKGKLEASAKPLILKQISPASKLEQLKDCDLVIEAIIENTEIKSELFKKLDALCKPETIFASNTSSISITKLASSVSRAEKVIGLHFFNPVPVMNLVEVIRGLQTSDTTYKSCLEVITQLGKEYVTANHDYPGFIVNRILMPLINEACFVLMEGIATAEDIDKAMKLGTNQPMGPLELADFIGLDTCLAICKIFQNELGEDKYRPCPLMVKYVEAGWVGRKSGRGFYTY